MVIKLGFFSKWFKKDTVSDIHKTQTDIHKTRNILKNNAVFLTKDKKLLCPRCNQYMRKITRQNITIDVCSKCKGMWLDDGEIESIISLSKTLSKKKVKSRAK
jgi:ribosomal protein L37AE/L43A